METTIERIKKEALEIAFDALLNNNGKVAIQEAMISERNRTIEEIQQILRVERGADITYKFKAQNTL